VGRPRGASNPPQPCIHAFPGSSRQGKAPHRPRRRGARRRRPPRRRAPTEPSSIARPCVRGGGGAPLQPRPRAHARRPRCGGRIGVPNRGPPPHRPAGRPSRARRRCDPERVDADPVASAANGGRAIGRPHARTRAASTGGTHPRGRGAPAAGGRVGPALTPARRHIDRGGWRHQQRHHRGRPDGMPTRVAVAVPAGRPPPRLLRAISGKAAAGR